MHRLDVKKTPESRPNRSEEEKEEGVREETVGGTIFANSAFARSDAASSIVIPLAVAANYECKERANLMNALHSHSTQSSSSLTHSRSYLLQIPVI